MIVACDRELRQSRGLMQAKTKQQGNMVIVELTKSKDIEHVKNDIHDKYGFWVTDEYARDLIAFVDALTQEMTT